MPRKHQSKSGSRAYSPRKRAGNECPRVRSWPTSSKVKLLGFAGYKAGMTHMFIKDNSENTSTSGDNVFTPVTVLDCPPLIPFSVRTYEKTSEGLKAKGEYFGDLSKKSKNLLSRKIQLPKGNQKEKDLEGNFVSVLVHTFPGRAIGKKKPEIFEVPIGGNNFEEQMEFAKEILGSEVNAGDIFEEGQYLDVISVSKGKGTEGPVKRFGIKKMKRKQKPGKERHVGTLGDRAASTRWTVPMAGQEGYHTRSELNKWLVKIGEEGSEMTPEGGFTNYGVIENNYIVLKGSVPGPTKRFVRLRPGIRAPAKREPEITYVSLTSNQGR